MASCGHGQEVLCEDNAEEEGYEQNHASPWIYRL